MPFIDTHAHLNDKAFDADRPAVIEKAIAAGVSRIVEVACAPDDWAPAEALCALYRGGLTAAFGIHPSHTGEATPENLRALSGFLKKEICSALGEIGLDYYWDNSKKTEQARLLEEQLELSAAAGKVCSFHVRNGRDAAADNAHRDLARELKLKWRLETRRRARGVLHSFSGTWDDAKAGQYRTKSLGFPPRSS